MRSIARLLPGLRFAAGRHHATDSLAILTDATKLNRHGGQRQMQVRMVIFPGEDGLDVLVWGKGQKRMMRHRHFDCRTSMIAMLENLHLLTPEDGQKLEDFVFLDSCPLGSAEIEEDVLAAHGFRSA